MTDTSSHSAGPRRLWIPTILVLLQAASLVMPWTVEFENINLMFAFLFLGPMVATAGVVLWWLFLSGLSWGDRLVGLLVLAGIGAGGFFLADPTFQIALTLYGLAGLSTVWVVYLLLTTWLSWPARRVGLPLTLAAAAAAVGMLRLDGTWGNFGLQVSFRFSKTQEDRYVEGQTEESSDVPFPPAEPLRLAEGDWPGFRGPGRDGIVRGATVATDWAAKPPAEVWRRKVGPGWSSFAVVGDRLFTQEQRGPKEYVVCLSAETGKQLWAHSDEARFTEPIAGAGPRATPTFHDGKVYTMGAKGTLNCLDAATGKKVWARDIAADSGSKVPPVNAGWWGYSSSPLVASGVVSVLVSGTEGKLVVGYNAETGEPVWSAGGGTHSYASAHLATLGGVEQILAAAEDGLTSLDPATGKVLWQHDWAAAQGMPRCTQPATIGDETVLLGAGLKEGTRRIKVSRSPGGWSTEEVWTTKAISPYFNDFVVYNGHAYGFDGEFFGCAAVEDGEKRWRVRGYGLGQVLLLADQGLLLVLTEKGEVALLKADPEKRVELGRFKAIEGKTWNHAALSRGRLFVRNAEEAACYRLAESRP